MGIVTRAIAALTAIASVLWLFYEPGWGALVASLTTVGALITFALADELKASHRAKDQRHESDRRQLSRLFAAFPYDQSKHETLSADQAGVTARFVSSLDELLTYRNSPHSLLDKKVEKQRGSFLNTAEDYYEVLLSFVGWDERHDRLTPPYHLKGGPNEGAYRKMQRDVTEKARAFIAEYDALI